MLRISLQRSAQHHRILSRSVVAAIPQIYCQGVGLGAGVRSSVVWAFALAEVLLDL
jgi:hypothetical protein